MGEKAVAKTERNQRVVQMLHEGYTTRQVAEMEGISAARVSQINQAYQSQFTDDGTREYFISQAEGALAQLMPLIYGRGKAMVAPNGTLVRDPDTGEPLYDPYVKTDAVRTMLQLHERISRARALDKPKQQNTEADKEFTQAMTWVNEVAKANEEMAKANRELQARLAAYERQALEANSS